MRTKLTLLCVLFMSFFVMDDLCAQDVNTKFGKVSIDELKQDVCPIDSSAHAYFLFDIGETTFEYATRLIRDTDSQSSQKGFQLIFNRHLRIKILDSEAFSWADFFIKLYKNNSDEEKLLNVKANTYTLEGNKIIKTKFSSKDIFQEETSENIETAKFALPNVQEGCVIEVEYSIKSDFLFNLQDWYFQKTIPVLLSEYTTKIPEYYTYNSTEKGYYPVRRETSQARKTLSITYAEQTFGGFSSTQKSTSTYEYMDNITTYHVDNMPAFPNEKFLKSKENYVSKVEFELAYSKFPNQALNYYTTTWEQIDDDLLKEESFGKNLSKQKHLESDVNIINQTGKTGVDLLDEAFSLVKNKMIWNRNYGKYLNSTLQKAYKEGEGNCADVNLNLVALLRDLGINSYPVILSTQNNGIIMPTHPSVSSFNYVVAMALIDGETYLMDATDQNSMINLLPIRCLNDKGRIIGDTTEKWINLMDYKTYISRSLCDLSFDDDMNLSGKIDKSLTEYAAYNFKSEVNDSTDLTEYVKSFEEENTDVVIENLTIEGIDSSSANISLSYNVSTDNFVTKAGDVIYFSTSLDPFFNENPFKLDKREFPVEFDYPYTVQRTYSFKIPESYAVSELPESIALKLPENAGNFYYQVQQLNDVLNVNFYIQIKKSQFLPVEYDQIKSFFKSIVEKQNEMVVLKKV